jgi:hypothetical protein
VAARVWLEHGTIGGETLLQQTLASHVKRDRAHLFGSYGPDIADVFDACE